MYMTIIIIYYPFIFLGAWITFDELSLFLHHVCFIFAWPAWVSQLQTSRDTPILCQPTYRMCLCIGNSQLHTSNKHAMYGEPYNCGESTEGDLLQCLPGWQKYWLCLGSEWLTPRYGRKCRRWGLGLENSWRSEVYSKFIIIYFTLMVFSFIIIFYFFGSFLFLFFPPL